jgi:hypothetical protein
MLVKTNVFERVLGIEPFPPPRQPLSAGRREGGVMAEAGGACNRPEIDGLSFRVRSRPGSIQQLIERRPGADTGNFTVKNVGTAIAAATLMSLAAASQPDAAAATMDGDWTVHVITERGTCDHTHDYDVSVANGRIEYKSYTSVTLNGTVAPDGAVRVVIRHFDEGAQGSGRLTGRHGSGAWHGAGKGGACSGRWEAHRR